MRKILFPMIIMMLFVGSTIALMDSDVDAKNDKDKDKDKTASLEAGNFTGRYIDFSYDLEASTLTNFSFLNQSVFSSIVTENASYESQQVHNHLFKGDGESVDLKCHDNPIALIQIKGRENSTVHLNLTSGWSASQYNASVVNLTGNYFNASLNITKSTGSYLSVNNTSVVVFLAMSPTPHLSRTHR